MGVNMMILRNLSIKRKLVAIIMFTSSVALLLACTAFMLYELATYRSTITRELSTIADIVSESTKAAIAFDDPSAAAETLAALLGEPRIVSGCIYTKEGEIFACYIRKDEVADFPPNPKPDGVSFASNHLVLFRGVSLADQRIGTVYLKCNLREMYARLQGYAGIVGVVLVVSLLAALIISSLLQKVISRPILHLTETAGLVSEDKNYLIRATKLSGDETGMLVDTFNEMMGKIHTRDEALQEAQDKLEVRVVERTKELQSEILERKRIQEDLLVAMKSAEEANRAKSVFLANMSHELRTPLNAIIGYSEILEEDAIDAEQHSCVVDLQKIKSAGRHLLALINDVLDLSKIEAGKMELHPESFSISQMLDDAVNTIEPLAEKNGNTLVVNADRQGTMYADMMKFRQSLFNLLSNACKFTEKGIVTLKVAPETINGKEWIKWHVTDTGIGIASDKMQKLFQAFSQGDSSATRKFGGTGLGLAISQKFCRLMGGQITVESEVGIGSTFTIQLPADNSNQPKVDKSAPLAKKSEIKPDLSCQSKHVNSTVLVIDDDPNVHILMLRPLTRAGFNVVIASNGKEGLRLAGEANPCAIVLDVLMPDMDGWSVLKALKADPGLARIPVIVQTITDSKVYSMQMGATDYLQKPVQADKMIAALIKQISSTSDGTEQVIDIDDTRKDLDACREALLKNEEHTPDESASVVNELASQSGTTPMIGEENLEMLGDA